MEDNLGALLQGLRTIEDILHVHVDLAAVFLGHLVVDRLSGLDLTELSLPLMDLAIYGIGGHSLPREIGAAGALLLRFLPLFALPFSFPFSFGCFAFAWLRGIAVAVELDFA